MSTETMPAVIKLIPTERQVLEQIAMFGFTVEEALVKLPTLKGKQRLAIVRLLNRMRNRRLIVFETLYGSRECIRLSPRGETAIQTHGVTSRFQSRPLSEESKIRALAMLSFCTLSNVQRVPLISHSERNNKATWSYFYVDPSTEQRIGFLRVDMGGRGRWDRILAKCNHDAKLIHSDPRFAEAVGAGRAEVSLAVTLPHKAERLRQALNDQPLSLPIRIVVIPELLYLIAPPPEL